MTEKKLISVIVPCYNEEEVLPLFYKEITKVSAQMQEKYPELTFEYLLVDDGSKDRTLSKLRIMARYDSRVRYVSFSRNFGKESGIYAGLKESKGDYCVVMDADLQHPPAFLPKMYETVKSGQYDCATTRRVSREGESKVRSWFARRFYGIMNRISQTEIGDGAQDFRFMTRQMVDAVLSMSEYNRFSKGIFSWVGFRTKYLEYRNVERAAGKSSWSCWGLLKYSLEGMMGYSTAPLTATAGIGLVMFLLGIIMLIFTVVKKLCVGEPVAGFPTLFCTILLFGGLQLLCTGIVGLYLGKTYLEVKRRPIYIVRETEKDADKYADAESSKDAAAPAAGTEDDGYDDDDYDDDEYDDDEFDDEYDDDGEYEDEYEDAEDEAANAPAAPVRAAAVPVPVPVQVAAKKSEPQRPAKEDSLARAQRLKEETDAEFEALVDAAFEEADAQKKAANAEKKTPAAEAAPAETPEQKKEKFVVNINYDNDDLYDDYDDEEEYDDDEYEDDYEDEYDEAPVRPQPAARAAAARPAVRAAAVRGAAAAAEKEDAPSFGQKVKSFFKSLKDKISAAFAKSPEDQEPEEDEYDDYDDEAYDDYDEEYDEYDDGSEDDYDDDEDDDSDYEDDDDFEDDDDYDDFDDEDDPSDGRHGYRGAHY